MLSLVTDNELKALNESDLDSSCPFLIRDVSKTQFSIARNYGSIKLNGFHYLYDPRTDELIRYDCLRFLQKIRKKSVEKLISTNLEMF